MGMTIDEALNLLNNSKPKSNNAFSIQTNEAINVIDVTMRKYQMMQADYKNRLKADMVNILRELQTGIDEVAHYRTKDDPTLVVDMSKVNEIIQQKINKLRESEF